MAERSSRDIQRAFDEIAAKAAAAIPEGDSPVATVKVTRDDPREGSIGPRVPSPAEYAAAWNEVALGGELPPDTVGEDAAPRGSEPDATIPERIQELASLMRERLDRTADPMPAWAALTIIESLLAPDAPRTAIETDALSPDQAAALGVLRESIEIFVSQPDPKVVASTYESLATRLAAERPFRIAKAELCTRVRGYGQYDPMASTAFIAGRPQRVIVYVEVEGFGHRGTLESDRGRDSTLGDTWTVELSQELSLFKDGVKAWTRPAQRVTESSRNRRRDFYLVHEIELPRNLGIGRYTLKVAMRDLVNDAIDEAIVPITIIADESAALTAGDAARR